jgi:hypothetical protein
MSQFNELKLEQSDSINGGFTTYTITFVAITPVVDQDIFYLELPEANRAPKEPTCKPVKCLESVKCTTSKRTLIATLEVTGACAESMAEISFSVDDIENAPTMVTSDALKAYWTSREYYSVSEYYNPIPATVTN